MLHAIVIVQINFQKLFSPLYPIQHSSQALIDILGYVELVSPGYLP